MADDKFYSQREVSDRFKNRVPPRTLLNWAQWGLVEVAKTEEDGRGSHRFYTEDGLVQIGVVEILSDLGFPVERIRKIMKNYVHGKPARGKLTIAWSKGPEFLREVLQGGAAAGEAKIVIDVGAIRRRLLGG